jgi:DNA invertase Pin-like site-specific DNA recombinase
MTIYGYLRVNPQVVAGTADLWSWWMRFHGCSDVVVDVWQGPNRPPGFDKLLDQVRAGDEVRIPRLSAFGPTSSHVREAMKLFRRRGVLVVVMQEDTPAFALQPEVDQVDNGKAS